MTLAEPEDVEEVTPENCYNSSSFDFALIFATEELSSGTAHSIFLHPPTLAALATTTLLAFLLVSM